MICHKGVLAFAYGFIATATCNARQGRASCEVGNSLSCQLSMHSQDCAGELVDIAQLGAQNDNSCSGARAVVLFETEGVPNCRPARAVYLRRSQHRPSFTSRCQIHSRIVFWASGLNGATPSVRLGKACWLMLRDSACCHQGICTRSRAILTPSNACGKPCDGSTPQWLKWLERPTVGTSVTI